MLSSLRRTAKNIAAGIARAFGYDAAETSHRRRAPSVARGTEDRELDATGRARVIQSARDLQRRFSIAAWAVRKHLDYVSSFSFRCRTGVVLPNGVDLDQRVEDLVGWWSRAENFDAAGRHGLKRMLRLIEARRTLDGDVAIIKLADGRIQAIEGERIRSPRGERGWVHGVRIDDSGRAIAYAVHRRADWGASYQLDRIVPAERLILHGYFDRIDQVRGISPLAPALNTFADIYEGFEYALAKAKVAQMFGLVTYRNAEEPLGQVSSESDATNQGPFQVDLGRGPFHLDLDREDKAEFLENKTPSQEFYNFTIAMIHAALKSLDLPFSFYDEAHTNFYGSRGALIQYLISAKSKRNDNRELLTALTAWRLGLFILDGRLELPRGWTLADLMARCVWIPDGVPWWNPAQEATGHLMMLGGGLSTPQRICQEIGSDFYENIDDIAEALQYARARGVNLSFEVPPVESNIEETEDGSDDKTPVADAKV